MINMGLKDYIIRPIMRNLDSVIRNIEIKKKNSKINVRQEKWMNTPKYFRIEISR